MTVRQIDDDDILDVPSLLSLFETNDAPLVEPPQLKHRREQRATERDGEAS